MEKITEKQFFEHIDKKAALILSAVETGTNGNYNFKKDIVNGEDGENFIKNFLIYKGFDFVRKNNNKKYDLLMSYKGKSVKYEVKTDFWVGSQKDSGNIVVEFESRGKPSGINVTESDYFVYYFPNAEEVWNIKTEVLKNIIVKNKFDISENGGDKDSITKNYKIPRNKIKSYFKRYDVSDFPPKKILQ